MTTLTPTSTLCADHNAQAQTDTIFQDMHLSDEEQYSIKHVKGHQERRNLTHQVELNNVANALATSARESLTWKQRCTSPPLYPASHIAVSINSMIITCMLDRKLQQA
eukprot:13287246-Ditylum_brightwellii.AAC.1